MSGNRQFVDTNVLVYAHDVTAGDRHRRALALVAELWETRQGCLSVQVLQEFFVTTTRKIPKPLDAPAAARIIEDLAHWHVHAPAAVDVLAAVDIHQRTGASFRDAMILRSAQELHCQTLHSEDLNSGQEYDGIQVRNPFSDWEGSALRAAKLCAARPSIMTASLGL
jgi:predicted nucleic acid-binding protein